MFLLFYSRNEHRNLQNSKSTSNEPYFIHLLALKVDSQLRKHYEKNLIR